MAKITLIGNLTKDAETRTHEGRKYVLLQVAENILKRDDKGEYIKDDKGHYEASATYFYSIFFNAGEAAFEAQDLKKGHLVKLSGIMKLRTEKDSNNYDQYVLDRITGTWIDTNPFDKLSETDAMTSQVNEEDIPFVA